MKEKTMKFRQISIFALLALLLASLACTLFVGGPQLPAATVPVSTEAAASVAEQMNQAATAAAASGQMTLSISESQLTSLLTYRLQQESDPILTEPQVLLRDGEIQIYGKAVRGNLQANIRIALAATIDSNGRPQILVTAVDLGPLPAPEGLNNAINALVNEAFTGALGPAALGFRLESISIADGVMTLSGRVK